MEDLLRHFVPERWVKSVDFSSLMRVNAKFHTEKLERREDDLVYRMNLIDGNMTHTKHLNLKRYGYIWATCHNLHVNDKCVAVLGNGYNNTKNYGMASPSAVGLDGD